MVTLTFLIGVVNNDCLPWVVGLDLVRDGVVVAVVARRTTKHPELAPRNEIFFIMDNWRHTKGSQKKDIFLSGPATKALTDFGIKTIFPNFFWSRRRILNTPPKKKP